MDLVQSSSESDFDNKPKMIPKKKNKRNERKKRNRLLNHQKSKPADKIEELQELLKDPLPASKTKEICTPKIPDFLDSLDVKGAKSHGSLKKLKFLEKFHMLPDMQIICGPSYTLDTKEYYAFELTHLFEEKFLRAENCRVNWKLGNYEGKKDDFYLKVLKLEILYHWILMKCNREKKANLKEIIAKFDLEPDFLTDLKVLCTLAITPGELRPWKILAYKFHEFIFLSDVTNCNREEGWHQWDFYTQKFKAKISSAHQKNWNDNGIRDFSVYYATFSSEPKKLSCLYTAETDCVDKAGNPLLVKIEKDNRKKEDYRRRKYLRWYFQAYLGGIQNVIVGQRDTMSHVNNVISYNIEELRRRSQETWSRDECCSFLWNFLDKVKTLLKNAPDCSILTSEFDPVLYHKVRFNMEAEISKNFFPDKFEFVYSL